VIKAKVPWIIRNRSKTKQKLKKRTGSIGSENRAGLLGGGVEV
jgi:hypothetical protein